MALTFKETVFYQDQVDSGLETLDKGGLTFKEEVAIQDQVTEALEKLTGNTAEKSLYERLVAGEFNNLPWQQYYEKLREAFEKEYTGNTPFSSLIHSGTLTAVVRSYLENWYVPATDSMKEQAA